MGAALRMLQIVRWAMLVSVILYVFVAEQTARPASPNVALFYALTGMAMAVVTVTFIVRRTWAKKAETALAAQPGDPAAIKRWAGGYIVTYALCESIAFTVSFCDSPDFNLAKSLPSTSQALPCWCSTFPARHPIR